MLPNGRDLAVTDANKEDFIELMIKWRIERGVQTQTRALLNALHQVAEKTVKNKAAKRKEGEKNKEKEIKMEMKRGKYS